MPGRGETQQLTVTFDAAPGGPVVDPTGVSLSLIYDGDVVLGPVTTPTVVRDGVGLYRYEWEVPADAPLGTYTAAWSGTLPGQSGPSVGYETLEVTDGLTLLPELPDSCWPVDTSCADGWTTIASDNTPLYSDADKARAVSLAGQTMRMLTGYRVGGCPITVRPCTATCAEHTWHGTGPGWSPVNIGGTWLNIGCGHAGSCGCTALSELDLGYVGAVTQVLIDGTLLAPSAYRVDDRGLLVRTDGGSWPLCQDMAAPDTEPGTWSVTYLPAVAVDGHGAAAAGRLAGEYVKACAGGDCDLPTGTTQVVRNGVTMTVTPDLFPEGRTGIAVVDAYVQRWNPTRLIAPSTAWSPDLPRPRTTY